MPLDDDTKQAVSDLHFGFNAPLWGKAIRIQATRLRPIEDLAVRHIAARKSAAAGTASDAQLALIREIDAALESDPDADRAFNTLLHPTAGIDATFLIIAMRGLLLS